MMPEGKRLAENIFVKFGKNVENWPVADQN